MKKTTEAKIVQMLKDSAVPRYGGAHARRLLPALRETAKAILGTRALDLALEDEPAFFSRSTRTR
jgi:hypothetical protein